MDASSRAFRVPLNPKESRIKIVHLIPSLEIGGAETMLVKLVQNIDRAHFNNIVISMTGPGTFGDELVRNGNRVFSLGMTRDVWNPGGLVRLVRLLRQLTPDILQTWLYPADLAGVIAQALTRCSVLAWNVRCSDMDLSRYSPVTRIVVWLLSLLSFCPEIVITNSHAAEALHLRIGYRPKAWCVIPNGFDLSRFRPDPDARPSLRRRLNLHEDALLIGIGARYDQMKDYETFLAGAGRLAEAHKDVRFVAFGRGVDQQNAELMALLLRFGLASRVRLLGEQRDPQRIFAGLDIATLTSAFGEGFPNVLGEAMACGVPCVSTDVGDAARIIGDTGIIVPRRDPASLACAWGRLVSLDVEERTRLGRSARRRIEENYSLARVVGQYEETYARLAQAHRARN